MGKGRMREISNRLFKPIAIDSYGGKLILVTIDTCRAVLVNTYGTETKVEWFPPSDLIDGIPSPLRAENDAVPYSAQRNQGGGEADNFVLECMRVSLERYEVCRLDRDSSTTMRKVEKSMTMHKVTVLTILVRVCVNGRDYPQLQ